MKMELIDGENTILREIANKELHQRDVAQTYRLIQESGECETVDWMKINLAIIERWSKSGLNRIKESAFTGKCFAEKK